jgi:GNAT superfamily N-acetyltransferase
MTEMPGTITVYRPEMAAAVAQMFNDFNELWPGGFGGGIPYDENRVHDFLDKSSAVADLIALDEAQLPVGYCGLYPHWRDADTAFVTILGVIPRVKGFKFGRRLLLHAVNLAAAKGFRRVDLGTWAGNLDAVPLYKKTGLFWVPGSNVYMQNFFPGLTQNPLARLWFEKHPDWYACYQRELLQAPDDETVDGMAVYTYRFQAGEDSLLGRVDRYGCGFCEIESCLAGHKIGLKTRLDSHNILIGIPNALTITLTNDTSTELAVELNVEAFAGQAWQQPFPSSITLPANQTRSFTRSFLVDQTAQTYRSMEPSAVMRTRFKLSEMLIELVTGGKIQPAIELISSQGYQVVQPGLSSQVYLDLKNNAQQALRGVVNVHLEKQSAASQSYPFELSPSQLSGLIIPVTIPASGEDALHILQARTTLFTESGSADMPAFHFPLVSDHANLSAVAIENDARQIHLLTDQMDVQIELEGGNIHFGPRDLPGMRRPASFQAGPPFGMGPDSNLKFTYALNQNSFTPGCAATLVLSAESRQFPGLLIQKFLRVAPGQTEIEHWVTLTNKNNHREMVIAGRMYTGGFGGISINAFGTPGRSFTPLDGRVIVSDAQLPLMNDNMLPQTPEHWLESWTAVESLAQGGLAALMWQPEGMAKIKVRSGMLSSLEAASCSLSPGETWTIFHLWYGFGFTSIEAIRQRWNLLIGKQKFTRQETIRLETFPPIQARWQEGSTFLRGAQNFKTVVLDFVSNYPLAGELKLDLPDGWTGSFVPSSGVSTETIPMPEPTPGSSALIPLTIQIPAAASFSQATPRLHLSGEYEMDFTLPTLLTSSTAVNITPEIREGRPVMVVENGALQFLVTADVGGCLIRLQDVHGHTYFHDNFPDIQPQFFLPYHIGGLQPLYFSNNAEQSFTELETVQAEAIREGQWQGVRAAWTSQHQAELLGQAFSIDYLTLPGSEIIRIRFSHHNRTPRKIEWVGGFFANLAFDGSREEILIQAPGGSQVWKRNHVPKPFIGLANLRQPWTHFSRGAQSLLLAGLPKSCSTVTGVDFNQVIGGIMAAVDLTQPYSERSIEFLMAINQPAVQAMEIINTVSKA